ncbi:hypothetical protein HCTV-16_gp66 [Haloarcula virus HCTV-16]|nr:hypothetical protein HCTV-16_gp66 [Haloarcula virus HCTV-16]
MSQESQTRLDDEKEELMNEERLTEKQAAILAVFERNPQMSYSDIADAAGQLLPEDESVTGSYAGEQIKQRRASWFNEMGNRRRPESEVSETVEDDEDDSDVDDDEPEENGDEPFSDPDEVITEVGRPDEDETVEVDVSVDSSRVATLADWYDVTAEEAAAMAHAEKVSGVEYTGREQVEEEPLEGFTVTLEENTWLRLVAFLHLHADTSEGAAHEKQLMEIAGEITKQALEG